ncbi:dTDP-4-amino-4,6-dideoxygalactose transaminase [Melghirimyces profundicolus]|uniref:dTDP-4-amino-4,6-dideoxygalactose transaminase n=1 Tax=Melghirimyces profundicolus TaxID=1242148 RepID=A0A2T6C9A3_9BACL|nr:DegT/DnrJ/EryC1/StrS family aminotransferase [Melghirimyces profundicolus]PTX64899.1 dTDP-4-amino-4,6-dideoxygalactose transaminase [Melghirimyces profundicolus]
MEKLAIHGGDPVRTEPFPRWPVWGEEEKELLLEVLHSGKWGGTGRVLTGEGTSKLEELEKRLTAFQGARHGITTVNGTMAITVALQAAGIEPGDEVIMPPYTFIATATAALLFGAIPVFADVEEETLLLDPAKVEEAVTPRTKAVIPVHLAGASADMTRLKETARRYGLSIIEDSAQAVGTRWEDKGVGALGNLGTFSFQSGKNLTAGEGGFILTNDERLAQKAWSLANVGRVKAGGWYQHERIGWNLRMTEWQAAILLAQMNRLPEQLKKREQNARILDRLLGKISGIEPVKTDPRVTRHARHLYLFRIQSSVIPMNKEEFLRAVQAEGIPLSPGYVSLNRHPAVLRSIRKWTGEHRVNPCPVAERMADREAFWLGQNILLADERAMFQIARAIEKVIAYLGSRKEVKG